MKSVSYIFAAIFSLMLITNCGGKMGPANIEGPELSLNEALELEINHIYVKNWAGTGARPFFSVYIQDGVSEEFIVCAGVNEGLDIAGQAGIYYGKLSVPMVAVNGAKDVNTPIFNIIVVADQENPCPSGISDDDTIIGTVQINFGELLDAPIEIGSGDAYVTFRGRGHDDVEIPEMGYAATDALTVGEIYFEDSPTGDVIPDYYMVLYIATGSIFEFWGIIDPSDMPQMREPDLIYSWLNLAFDDTDNISTNENLLKRKARVELLKNDAELIGQTSEEFLGDIIGRTIEFTNGKGYITFRSISN